MNYTESKFNKPPLISVVMPAFNAQHYIAEAIDSVLSQTVSDIELIIIDDGSTDNTLSIINKYKADHRVVVISHNVNVGLIHSLEYGYSISKSKFIARMDSDDVARPHRFQKQLDFLVDNPEVDLVGGSIKFFGDGVKATNFVFPLEHNDIHCAMLFYCPIAHPTIMFRRELLDNCSINFDSNFVCAEDYHLWSRLLNIAKVANIPDVVLDYRLHNQQVSTGSSNKQYFASALVRKLMLDNAGVCPNDEELLLHESVILEKHYFSSEYLLRLAKWFCKIEKTNFNSNYWNGQSLHKLLCSQFVKCAIRNPFFNVFYSNPDPVNLYLKRSDCIYIIIYRFFSKFKSKIRIFLSSR